MYSSHYFPPTIPNNCNWHFQHAYHWHRNSTIIYNCLVSYSTAFPLLLLPFSHRILQSNLCLASSLLHFHISVALHLGLQRWGSCLQVYFLPLQSRMHLYQWQGGRECPLAAILDMCQLPAVLSLPHGSSVMPARFYGTQRSPTQQYKLFGSFTVGFGGACFVVGIRRSTCVHQTFTLLPLLSVEGWSPLNIPELWRIPR